MLRDKGGYQDIQRMARQKGCYGTKGYEETKRVLRQEVSRTGSVLRDERVLRNKEGVKTSKDVRRQRRVLRDK